MASWLLIVPRRPRLLPRQPRLLHGAGLAAGARAGGGRRTPRGARQAPGGAGAQGQGAGRACRGLASWGKVGREQSVVGGMMMGTVATCGPMWCARVVCVRFTLQG